MLPRLHQVYKTRCLAEGTGKLGLRVGYDPTTLRLYAACSSQLSYQRKVATGRFGLPRTTPFEDVASTSFALVHMAVEWSRWRDFHAQRSDALRVDALVFAVNPHRDKIIVYLDSSMIYMLMSRKLDHMSRLSCISTYICLPNHIMC